MRVSLGSKVRFNPGSKVGVRSNPNPALSLVIHTLEDADAIFMQQG